MITSITLPISEYENYSLMVSSANIMINKNKDSKKKLYRRNKVINIRLRKWNERIEEGLQL